MKKIIFLFAIINICLVTSCTKSNIEEEIYYTQENEFISVDREEIDVPGDQNKNGHN